MAGESYYFMFSFILVLIAIFSLINLLLLRKGRTVFGVTLKPGTEEYKRAVKLASNRNIAIIVILTLAFIANLIYDVNRLRRLDEYSDGLLLFLAAFVVLISAVVLVFTRNQAKSIYELGGGKKQK